MYQPCKAAVLPGVDKMLLVLYIEPDKSFKVTRNHGNVLRYSFCNHDQVLHTVMLPVSTFSAQLFEAVSKKHRLCVIRMPGILDKKL